MKQNKAVLARMEHANDSRKLRFERILKVIEGKTRADMVELFPEYSSHMVLNDVAILLRMGKIKSVHINGRNSKVTYHISTDPDVTKNLAESSISSWFGLIQHQGPSKKDGAIYDMNNFKRDVPLRKLSHYISGGSLETIA